MGVGDEEVAHDVLFARRHADEALAAAALLPVRLERRALDVARVRRGDDDVLVGDEVFDAEVAGLLDEVGAALVAVLRPDRAQLVEDDGHHQLVARQNGAQLLDELHQLGELVDDLLPLEARQALELHVEDRLRLERREAEAA